MPAKKRFKPVGIQDYFTALVYEARGGSIDDSRDVYQADAPSLYAEARLGVASYSKIKRELNHLVDVIRKGGYRGKLPFFRQWMRENKGYLDISHLEKVLSKRNGSLTLLRESAVGKAGESNQDTLVARVRARESAVADDTLKEWDVDMSYYALVDRGKTNPAFRRNCQCGFKGKHTNRRKLWSDKIKSEKRFLDELLREGLTTHKELGKELHIGCYHEDGLISEIELQNNRGKPKTIRGLQEPTTIAFDFIDRWDLVFESFARRFKYKQLYGEIDNYLFEQDIVSPYFKKLIQEGKVNKEVIKKSRHIGWVGNKPTPKKVIMALHRSMLEKGFKYSGFAWDFVKVGNKRKSYKTIGIVYENEARDKSHHIVYDNTFWMPYVVEKDFNVGNRKNETYFKKNPVNLLFNKLARRGWTQMYEIDDRTQRLAKVTIVQRRDTIEPIKGAKEQYQRYRRRFENARRRI